ncbi:Transferase [Corchorus olitorius]|uniref:Transferase n=1 Tax=Corchorus olitorius TaxID=93759 RepID=A0A1R3IFS8_9ROSI|nr:Transferase [Corchorus olitorius]
MELEVEVMSREIVQPSSPTPDRLRHYQLSFLDQIAPQVYMPFILFYPEICVTEANKIKASHHLKESISKALTYFYPLAGRIRSRSSDNPFVDCNDEGIPFVKAKVKCQISDVIKDPIPLELNKLLPFINIYDAVELPLGIQFNVFECGGIGVGVCMSHIVGDALSLVAFVNTWAAIARGEKELVLPEFASASLFPPRIRPGYNPNIPASIPQSIKKLRYRRLVFTASKIEEIRGKYADNSSSNNPKLPTRVEALSAFIWSRFAASTEDEDMAKFECDEELLAYIAPKAY